MSQRFRRVVLKYCPAPRFDELRREYKLTLRGVLDFVKDLESSQQYRITLIDSLSNAIGSTPDTIIGEKISEKIKDNWERMLSKIEIKELVIVK